MHIPYSMWSHRCLDISSPLGFSRKGFAFHYRPNSVCDKKFLHRSLFRHFVDTKSKRTLYRIYFPSLQRIHVSRGNDVKILKLDTGLHRSRRSSLTSLVTVNLKKICKLTTMIQQRKHLASTYPRTTASAGLPTNPS